MKRLLYFPFVILGLSFAILCVHARTAWPWHVIIHEDGHRDFIDTVFYFEHALGELPLELLLSAAVAGAVLRFDGRPHVSRLAYVVLACIAVDGVIVVGALIRAGAHEALMNLLQYHTRAEEPMIFGSHWRYHLLSQAALMLLPIVMIGRMKNRSMLSIAAWVVFGGLTILFGVNSAPFVDARHLGHESRELFTHTLVTIPLAVGIVAPRSFRWKSLPKAVTVSFVAIAAYLAVGVALTHAQQHAQTSDWTRIVCGHFFEHTFSYLVVAAHALLFYTLGARHA